MKTRKVSTRFMDGNVDVEGIISDIIANENSWDAIVKSGFSFDEAIFSDGFIDAIDGGKIPLIDTIEESYKQKKEGEYHHFIFNDECYIIYFN